jgi:hypothetical protein
MSQLIKPQIKWTPEKIQLLRDEYPSGDKDELCLKLGIKRKTLNDAAKRFKVRCLLRPNGRKVRGYKAKELLNDSLESYYWHGFIMADGHIGERNTICVTLSNKDVDQLKNLKSFLKVEQQIFQREYTTSYSNNTKSANLTISDIDTCEQLRIMYNVGSCKTKNPPSLECLSNDGKFLSFFIGFFDGDGCFDIRKTKVVAMKIECHVNWYPTLETIQKKLQNVGIQSTLKITSRGYSCLRIYKQETFKKLKTFIIQNNIPVMNRKWNKIEP